MNFSNFQFGRAILITLAFSISISGLGQDQVEFKDGDDNPLIVIQDEGTGGSISLPDLLGQPQMPTNKLYNLGGFLYFNGQLVDNGTSLPQTLSISNDTLFLTDGGFVVLPSGTWVFDGDDIRPTNIGDVKIGSDTSSTSLNLIGNLKYQDGAQAEGKVLFSDSEGNAAWRTPNGTNLISGAGMAEINEQCPGLAFWDQLGTDNSTFTSSTLANAMLVDGNILYMYGAYSLGVNGEVHLNTYDVSNPDNLQLLGSVYLADLPGGITSPSAIIKSENAIFLPIKGQVFSIDVSDPTSPIVLDSAPRDESWRPDAKLYNNTLYIRQESNILQFDVSDPSNMIALPAIVPFNAGAINLAIGLNENFLYSIEIDGGLPILEIFDIQDPQNVFHAATSSVSGYGNSDFLISGDHLYIYDAVTFNFDVLDVSDPLNPVLLGSVNPGLSGISTTSDFGINGNTVLVFLDNDEGLQLFDVSDPTNPVFDGTIYAAEIDQSTIRALDVIGNTAYVFSKSDRTFLQLQYGCPTTPVIYNPNTGSIEPGVDSDHQTLSIDNHFLNISNGNGVNLIQYADNTDDQDVFFNGTNLFIENGNSADLSSLMDNTDAQQLSFDGSELSITGGNTQDLSALLDNTDDQQIFLVGTDLNIEDGNTADLSSFMDNTDQQQLSFNGSDLSISGGNTQDLSSLLDNTDDQQIFLVGTDLSIEDGNSADLSSFLDNTDSQSLSFSNNQLSISGGNAIDLSLYSTTSLIEDGDSDTRIETEQLPDEDKIRFIQDGVEYWTFDGGRIDVLNTGGSTFIGLNTGKFDDLSAGNNTGFGNSVLTENVSGSHNTAMGYHALEHSTGFANTAIGSQALLSHTEGSLNTAVGSFAFASDTTGTDNVAVGSYSGMNIQYGVGNVLVGSQAGLGAGSHSKSQNVMIGTHSGRDCNGSGNVFIGYHSGKLESGSNKLIIENSDSSSPLIYGEFDNDLVEINGALDVSGDVAAGNVNAMGAVNAATINANTSLQVGANGSTLTSIIKVTKNVNFPNVPSNDVVYHNITGVTNATVGSTVFISPAADFPGSLYIGNCRVSANGTVRVQLLNEGNNGQDVGAMDYYITVIK